MPEDTIAELDSKFSGNSSVLESLNTRTLCKMITDIIENMRKGHLEKKEQIIFFISRKDLISIYQLLKQHLLISAFFTILFSPAEDEHKLREPEWCV